MSFSPTKGKFPYILYSVFRVSPVSAFSQKSSNPSAKETCFGVTYSFVLNVVNKHLYSAYMSCNVQIASQIVTHLTFITVL